MMMGVGVVFCVPPNLPKTLLIWKSSVPPALMVTVRVATLPTPNGPAVPAATLTVVAATSVPLLTVILPLNVFAAVFVKTPAPSLMNAPAPEMTPDRIWLAELL